VPTFDSERQLCQVTFRNITRSSLKIEKVRIALRALSVTPHPFCARNRSNVCVSRQQSYSVFRCSAFQNQTCQQALSLRTAQLIPAGPVQKGCILSLAHNHIHCLLVCGGFSQHRICSSLPSPVDNEFKSTRLSQFGAILHIFAHSPVRARLAFCDPTSKSHPRPTSNPLYPHSLSAHLYTPDLL
jgi:hypothetical protein